jgi:hypothetical protein
MVEPLLVETLIKTQLGTDRAVRFRKSCFQGCDKIIHKKNLKDLFLQIEHENFPKDFYLGEVLVEYKRHLIFITPEQSCFTEICREEVYRWVYLKSLTNNLHSFFPCIVSYESIKI